MLALAELGRNKREIDEAADTSQTYPGNGPQYKSRMALAAHNEHTYCGEASYPRLISRLAWRQVFLSAKIA